MADETNPPPPPPPLKRTVNWDPSKAIVVVVTLLVAGYVAVKLIPDQVTLMNSVQSQLIEIQKATKENAALYESMNKGMRERLTQDFESVLNLQKSVNVSLAVEGQHLEHRLEADELAYQNQVAYRESLSLLDGLMAEMFGEGDVHVGQPVSIKKEAFVLLDRYAETLLQLQKRVEDYERLKEGAVAQQRSPESEDSGAVDAKRTARPQTQEKVEQSAGKASPGLLSRAYNLLCNNDERSVGKVSSKVSKTRTLPRLSERHLFAAIKAKLSAARMAPSPTERELHLTKAEELLTQYYNTFVRGTSLCYKDRECADPCAGSDSGRSNGPPPERLLTTDEYPISLEEAPRDRWFLFESDKCLSYYYYLMGYRSMMLGDLEYALEIYEAASASDPHLHPEKYLGPLDEKKGRQWERGRYFYLDFQKAWALEKRLARAEIGKEDPKERDQLRKAYCDLETYFTKFPDRADCGIYLLTLVGICEWMLGENPCDVSEALKGRPADISNGQQASSTEGALAAAEKRVDEFKRHLERLSKREQTDYQWISEVMNEHIECLRLIYRSYQPKDIHMYLKGYQERSEKPKLLSKGTQEYLAPQNAILGLIVKIKDAEEQRSANPTDAATTQALDRATGEVRKDLPKIVPGEQKGSSGYARGIVSRLQKDCDDLLTQCRKDAGLPNL